jgi:hypothetical protein
LVLANTVETKNYTFNSFCFGVTEMETNLSYQNCCINIGDSTCCSVKGEDLLNFILPSCCQNYVYDTVISLCCDNAIVPIGTNNGDPQCCGAKVIDNSVSICCQNNILNKGILSDARCCGVNAYDSLISKCVDDKQIVFL